MFRLSIRLPYLLIERHYCCQKIRLANRDDVIDFSKCDIFSIFRVGTIVQTGGASAVTDLGVNYLAGKGNFHVSRKFCRSNWTEKIRNATRINQGEFFRSVAFPRFLFRPEMREHPRNRERNKDKTWRNRRRKRILANVFSCEQKVSMRRQCCNNAIISYIPRHVNHDSTRLSDLVCGTEQNSRWFVRPPYVNTFPRNYSTCLSTCLSHIQSCTIYKCYHNKTTGILSTFDIKSLSLLFANPNRSRFIVWLQF